MERLYITTIEEGSVLGNGYMYCHNVPSTLRTKATKAPSTPTSVQVVSSTPGRLRLRLAPTQRQSANMERICKALQAHSQVERLKTNIHHGSITISHTALGSDLENIYAVLKDLGVVFAETTTLTGDRSIAAAGVANAALDLNQRVARASNGAIDLRFLFPLGLGLLSIRQLAIKGLQLEIIPWYVLAWYAFDSFIKLHGTDQLQTEDGEKS